jgi:hypothetical protein
VHVCTTPVLALAVVLSPLPAATFFWLELLTLAVAILASAGASWKLRSTGRWVRTRSARSLAVFGILLVAIVRLNTRSGPGGESVLLAWIEPSPLWWHALAKTVPNPAILFSCLLLLYAGFLSYYALQSIRSLERQ